MKAVYGRRFSSNGRRALPETVIDTPVAHIDIMPTLAAAANAPLPEGVAIDGRNLLPLATGSGTIQRDNDALFWQSGYTRVVRAGDWKLHYEGKRDKSWLFNLADDPTEQNNLAATQPEKLKQLRTILDAHKAAGRGPLYPAAKIRRLPLTKHWLIILPIRTNSSGIRTDALPRS